MNILVTGHLGFIGTHTYQALKGKHCLRGLDKKNGYNISKMSELASLDLQPDVIIHLAANCSTAKSLKEPVSDFYDNAVATVNICELAKQTNAKLIYTSSCKVEPNEMGIRAPYGLSKYVGELYVKEYAGCYGIEYVINRPGTVYGPGQEGSSESGWIAWFLKARKENKPITIYGDGEQVRDILYVSDYVDLLLDQVKNFHLYQGETYDVGGGKDNAVSLLDMLRFIEYDNYEFSSPRKGDVRRFVSDNSKVSSVNNWKPKISWQDGINKLLKE